MKANDYYEILELKPNATATEVKRAYRRLAHKYHPDTGKSVPSDKTFNDICRAYEVLGDPEARRSYDLRSGLMAAHRDRMDSTRRQGQSRGHQDATGRPTTYRSDAQLKAQVTLVRPARNGATAQPGFGAASYRSDLEENTEESKETFLQRLKGGVRYAFDRPLAGALPRSENKPPETTSLRGERVYRFTIDALESLQGTTRDVALEHNNAVRTVKVNIPAGVHGGDVLTIQCPVTGGFPAETIKIAVQIEPHPLLEREGLDLTVKLPITLGEAIKGAELQVPTIHGPLKVKIPAGWQESKRLRIKGKGLVHPSGACQGDLYVKVYVVTPPSSSAEALHLADAIDRLYTKGVRQDIPLSLGEKI